MAEEGEKTLNFEYGDNEKGLSVVDEKGKRLKIFLTSDKKISSIIFSNGRKADFSWIQAPNGFWLVENIKYDDKNPFQTNNVLEEADCYQVCEDAAAYTVLAAGICVSNGPDSTACWTATAAAAWKTYQCYRCVRREALEEGTQSYINLKKKMRWEIYYNPSEVKRTGVKAG
jgi:hypothetical protein